MRLDRAALIRASPSFPYETHSPYRRLQRNPRFLWHGVAERGLSKVIEAESGDTGLEMARQHKPDLTVTDINMPGGGGEALLHRIRRRSDLCSKQVVLMTGRPDMVSPRRGMEEGADDFWSSRWAGRRCSPA